MARYFILIQILVLFFLGGCQEKPNPGEEKKEPFVYRVVIREAITPASLDILDSAVEQAEADGASALIVILDSPGGLMQSMDDMVRKILASKVPVLGFVNPVGSSCGSACVFILYSSHVAAMSEATNLGSATPVTMGGGGEDKQAEPAGPLPPEAGANDAVNMKRKIINHARAQIRGIAEYRERNPVFAEDTITRAANITSAEALRIHAIDYMAATPEELLTLADGKTVRMLTGTQTLRLKNLKIVDIEHLTRSSVLSLISHPGVAYILMMIGVLGIFAEIQYPGTIFPGVLGSICLLLGLYAQQTLSVDYTAYGLIALGIIFFVMEIKIPSYGLLSVAGTVCLLLGSLMMVRTDEGLKSGVVQLVIAVSIAMGAILSVLVYKSAQIMRKKPSSGSEELVGYEGEVVEPTDSSGGRVFLHGEFWTARSEMGILEKGSRIQVVRRDGMLLTVKRI